MMLRKSYTFFSFILLVFVWCVPLNTYGQDSDLLGDPKNFDAAPFITVPADTAPPANFPYPELFSWHYSTIAPQNLGTVGAMFFQNQYYLNSWNSTNLFLYDGGLAGPQNFTQVVYQGSIRDLTTDGTWLYGSPASTTIHRLDANGISQGTITSGGGVARAIAFSPDENAFFVSDFNNNIGVINATTGALIRTLTGTATTMPAKYGMAYTTAAQVAGGPYLWVWAQAPSNTDTYNRLWKADPQTGNIIDTYLFGPLPPNPGGTQPFGVSGGAEIVEISGHIVLLLNYQNFEVEGYSLGQLAGPGVATDPNPAHGATGVEINADLSWTNPAGATSIEVFFGTDAGNLTSVYSGAPVTTFDPGVLQYATQYFWRVNETDTSGTSVGAIWNFTTRLPGPGPATNPNPANGATNVNIDADLSWDNPVGAASIEVFFGTDAGNLTSVYSGAPVTTFDPGTMQFFTQYFWRVDETDATGTYPGTVWNFRTEFAPGVNILTAHPGPANNGGSSGWAIFFNLIANPDYDIEVFQMTTASSATANSSFSVEFFTRNGNGLGGPVGSGPGSSPTGWTSLGSVPVTQGGTSSGISLPFATPSIDVSAGDTMGVAMQFTGAGPRYFGTGSPPYGTYSNASLTIITGDARTIPFTTTGSFFSSRELVGDIYYNAVLIPVELASFTASVIDGKVNLNWQTASETNNYGFDVERKAAGQQFIKVGFVAGYGTTSETKNYSFVDKSVTSGSYTYRLKQVDFDGSFEYSNEVEVDLTPSVFSLSQNYPNPFNPSTTIDFSLASDSKVALKVFDILGQKVTTIINGNLAAGIHKINFDASLLNSGVYFYTIDAKGIDGTNFTTSKKMMLTK